MYTANNERQYVVVGISAILCSVLVPGSMTGRRLISFYVSCFYV